MKLKLYVFTGLITVLPLLTSALRADLITLKGGQVINGRLYRDSDQYIIAPTKGQPFKVPLNDVTGITLQSTASPAKQAANDWVYTQTQVKQSRSLPVIISDLKAYIGKHGKSPEVKAAKKSLAVYLKYQKSGYISVAGRWISPAARRKLLALCAGQNATAEKLVVAGKLAQAHEHVAAALQVDPTNPDALILQGVIDYQRNEIQAASRAFAAAEKSNPKDIVALNDQAITNFRQRRQPAALVAYQKALHIDNGNRMLLDNIAAALEIYKKSKRTGLYRNLRASFTLADNRMKISMAKKGLYRFGSGWVDAKTEKTLEKRMTEYQSQKAALESQYQMNLVALQSVNLQIYNVNRQINALLEAVAILQVNQGSVVTQTGMIDLGNQAVLDSDVAALTQAQSVQMQLSGKRVSILAGIKSLKLQAALLEKHAPQLAVKPTQFMMLPMDRTDVPLPPLLPVTAITALPRALLQKPAP